MRSQIAILVLLTVMPLVCNAQSAEENGAPKELMNACRKYAKEMAKEALQCLEVSNLHKRSRGPGSSLRTT